MLSMFEGRINRKTYIIGNLVALAIFLAISATVIVPLAIINIVLEGLMGGKGSVPFFDYLYYVIVVPLFLYGLYFIALIIRRIHDIGYPGLLVVIAFIATGLIARKMDLWMLNLLCLLLLFALCLIPGQASRNRYGNKPPPRFYLDDLKPNAR